MEKWTIEEDCKLLTLVRQHFPALVKHNQLNATMPFSQQLHAAFNSPHRDASALLFRLKQTGILGFAGCPGVDTAKQPFRCLINDDLALYDYSINLPSLKQALHPETVTAVPCPLVDTDMRRAQRFRLRGIDHPAKKSICAGPETRCRCSPSFSLTTCD